MVTKKKRIYLGLLLSFFGAGNVIQAYKLTFRNRTPYKVMFKVSYKGKSSLFGSCEPDRKELPAGGSTKISSGICTVNKVTADVYEPGSKVTKGAQRVIKASRYHAIWGRAGNSKFSIRGPFYTRGVVSYRVTRD